MAGESAKPEKKKTPLAPARESRTRGVFTQQSAKNLRGQDFSMHEKTLTLVSRLAFHSGRAIHSISEHFEMLIFEEE